MAGRSLNQEPEQDRLDGLQNTKVDVVALSPAAVPTPHVELLHCRTPQRQAAVSPVQANDLASVRQVHKEEDLEGLAARLERSGATFVSPGIVRLQTGGQALSIRDPDGHMIMALGVRSGEEGPGLDPKRSTLS